MENKKEVNDAQQIEKEKEDYNSLSIDSFEELDLKNELLRGIYSYGFEKPSIIQQKAIKPLIDGHDVIGQAQSGTGKTATYSIGVLQNIDHTRDNIQAVILTHTRELALQVRTVITNISSYLNINLNLSVGGTSSRENIDELLGNPHIVIGTPGRVLDMINKKALNTKYLA